MLHKFYHGTSSIYLPSIKEYGLGGINPNIRYDLLELLSFLYSECERHISYNAEYNALKQATYAMVKQTFLRIDDGPYSGVHNFRHDNIYLAYSEQRAVSCAVINEYGSEILSRIVILFRLLSNAVSSFKIPQSLDDLDIRTIANTKVDPVLIEAFDVDPVTLKYENGSKADDKLTELLYAKATYTEEAFHYFSQKHNFELCKPIPATKLKFYKIIPEGNIYKPETFTYNLLECT